MKKSRLILALLMILTMLVFAGCADTTDKGTTPDNGTTTQENGNGTTGNGVKDDLENAGDNIRNDVDKAADNVKDSVTGGGVDNNTANPAPTM